MDLDFYIELPNAPDFASALEEEHLRPFPEDWVVIKTDMVSSTRHLLEGRYKEVNSASALLIMAAANVVGNMNFPFIFGGDGVTLAVPAKLSSQMRPVLAGVIHNIKTIYGFKYRLAFFPVQELYRRGLTLRCGATQISSRYRQAVLVGTGIDWMDAEFKNADSPFLVDVQHEPFVEPDMSGFSCRWQDFPSPREETVALIVRPRTPQALQEVIEMIHQSVDSTRLAHPLRVAAHKMNFKDKNLRTEAIIMSGRKSGFRYRLWLFLIKLQMMILPIVIAFKLPIVSGKKKIAQIKMDNVESSDTQKIENSYYTVLALKRSEREKIERRLEQLRQEGKVYYGLHRSNRALLTCLIQMEVGDEVHFVDAADGGYAMASQQLKAQMKSA